HDPRRARRRDPAVVPGQARGPEEARIHGVRPGADHLRAAVQRGGARFLRQAEDALAGLRVARLSCDRLLAVAAGEARYPRERRSGGRAVGDRAPRHGVRARPRAGVEDARADPAPDVRGGDSGGDRRTHHRARVREGDAQERAREVLRRRHHAQTEAPREAEGRQETHEARRQGRDSAGSLPRRAENGHGLGKLRAENCMAERFKKSTLREYFESIVIAVILALFIRTFVVQAFKIPTGSMENNLLIGDHLLVNKLIFSPTASPLERALMPISTIKRGDVIVFKYP